MNVLIIPAFIYTKSDPTLGSFVFEQAEALSEQGHSVFMLYCDTYSIKYWKQYNNYSEEDEVKNDVSVFRTRAFCPFKHESGFYGTKEIFTRKIIDLYEKKLSSQKIDIIHAHCCAWAGYAAMKLSEKTGIPYVITEHSTIYGLKKDIIKGKYLESITRSFSQANKVICVSSALKKLISEYTDNTVVVGNVVDTELFTPIEFPESRKGSEFTFLSVCYLKSEEQIKKKGIDILIAAFADVVNEYPGCQLKIGGGGSGVAKVKEIIDSYGVENNVLMLGSLSRVEVADQMRICDCFVLPSRYETFGVVYAEAMACGKPVIGTKTGGPDSFVDDSNGILVDVEDVNALVEAMKYMISNKDKYNSDSIREQICGQFSSHAIAHKLEIIYNSAREESL